MIDDGEKVAKRFCELVKDMGGVVSTLGDIRSVEMAEYPEMSDWYLNIDSVIGYAASELADETLYNCEMASILFEYELVEFAEKLAQDASSFARLCQAKVNGDPETIIVTRHGGVVDWLAQHGIVGEVIDHAHVESVRGKRVIGNLPMHLASVTAIFGCIDMPLLTAEWRGKDISADMMDAFGAKLTWYKVQEVVKPEE